MTENEKVPTDKEIQRMLDRYWIFLGTLTVIGVCIIIGYGIFFA